MGTVTRGLGGEKRRGWFLEPFLKSLRIGELLTSACVARPLADLLNTVYYW